MNYEDPVFNGVERLIFSLHLLESPSMENDEQIIIEIAVIDHYVGRQFKYEQ